MIGKLTAWLLCKREERVEGLVFDRRVTVSVDDAGLSTVYPDGST